MPRSQHEEMQLTSWHVGAAGADTFRLTFAQQSTGSDRFDGKYLVNGASHHYGLQDAAGDPMMQSQQILPPEGLGGDDKTFDFVIETGTQAGSRLFVGNLTYESHDPFLPEPSDEVLVVFEHGSPDPSHPDFLWWPVASGSDGLL